MTAVTWLEPRLPLATPMPSTRTTPVEVARWASVFGAARTMSSVLRDYGQPDLAALWDAQAARVTPRLADALGVDPDHVADLLGLS